MRSVEPMLTQYVLMGIFFGVIVGWYLLGIKSYGTGDYYQP
jgi:hypothetical protein